MEITEQRLQSISLLILTVIVCGTVLHLLQDVFMPFVLSVFFALGLSPLVNFQIRVLRFPTVLAVFTTLLISLVFFWVAGLLVIESFEQLTKSASLYENQIIQLVQRVLNKLPFHRLGISAEQLINPLKNVPFEGIILATTNSILHGLSLFLLVFVFITYLLFVFAGQTIQGDVWSQIESRIQRYLVAKSIVSILIGLIVGITLSVLNIELALVFGLFAGLLNFIPALGPVIASLLPWPVILMSPELSPFASITGLLFPGTLFFITGNFIEPKVLGDSVQLHPLTVLVVLIFWGVLWGALGMLLAIPITSILGMLSSKLEITRPVANLLAGNLGILKSNKP